MSVYTIDPTINNSQLTQTEADLYGSSRIGIFSVNRDVHLHAANHTLYEPVGIFSVNRDVHRNRIINFSNNINTFTRGNKFFELTNHLGNVLATISDKKLQIQNPNNLGQVLAYTADIIGANDYYPFGMAMPGRQFTQVNNSSYRYGFNGKEKDNEVKGDGNQQDYGMRIYDDRLGRFLSVDPLARNFPYYSPYQFAGNKPTWAVDLDGAEELLLGLGDLFKFEGKFSDMDLEGATTSAAEWAGRIESSPAETFAPKATPLNNPSTGTQGTGGFQPWITQYSPQLRSPAPNQNSGQQQSPQTNPQPQANPQRQFDPKQAPTKEDDGGEGYYVYETGSSDKIASGMVDKSAGTLPYFGITKNAVVASSGTNGRYYGTNSRAQNLPSYKGILGKTDYITAAGAEAALIALNTYGKNFQKKVITNQHSSADVKKSTRVDNKMFSNKNREMILKGIVWLRGQYGKNWKDQFLHNENKKGKNNP